MKSVARHTRHRLLHGDELVGAGDPRLEHLADAPVVDPLQVGGEGGAAAVPGASRYGEQRVHDYVGVVRPCDRSISVATQPLTASTMLSDLGCSRSVSQTSGHRS
jgi:hypothetical protein